MQEAKPSISVEIGDLPPLGELEAEWRDLQQRAAHSFFNSWAWIGSWLESLPAKIQPRLIRARAQGRVVGLATLCERVVTRGGVIRSRTLALNATADPWLDELTIQHNGLLCEQGVEAQVFDACMKAFLERGSWDEIRIDGMDQMALVETIPGALVKPILNIRPEYFVDLDAVRGPGKQYRDRLPQKIRSQLRGSIKDCPGELTFRMASTIAEAEEYMRELKRLHTESWGAKNEPGAFANQYFDKFHADLIRKRFHEGVIQISRLTVSDRPVGYVYNFLYQGRIYAYQSGFDMQFDNRSSWRPGLLTHMFAVESGVASGHSVYSFLAGTSRYKKHLSTAESQMAWVVLQRPRLKFRIEGFLRVARDWLKNSIGLKGGPSLDEVQGTQAKGARPLSVEVVDDAARFQELRKGWAELHQQSSNDSMFLAWEWLYSWWTTYILPFRSLYLMLVWDQDRLMGIAPFWRQGTRLGAAGPARIRFLGTGEPESEEVSSTNLDLLAVPGFEAAVAEAVWSELKRRSADWDDLVLEGLLESSVMAKSFGTAVQRDGWVVQLRDRGLDFRIALPESLDAYMATLRPSVRDAMRKALSKLDKHGHTTVSMVAREEDIDQGLAELARLNGMRQAVKGRVGAFSSARFIRFHREVIRSLRDFKRAQLAIVTFDGRNVGAWLNYEFKGRVCAYNTGFDPKEKAIRSLGVANNGLRIRLAVTNGHRLFDFLHGEAGSYKGDYGCETEQLLSLRIFNRSAKGRAVLAAHQVAQVLRKLKARLGGRKPAAPATASRPD